MHFNSCIGFVTTLETFKKEIAYVVQGYVDYFYRIMRREITKSSERQQQSDTINEVSTTHMPSFLSSD